MRSGKVHPIVLGSIFWIVLCLLSPAQNLLHHQPFYFADIVVPIALVLLGLALLKHVRVARFTVMALCLFYAMDLGFAIPVGGNALSLAALPYWAFVALLLWLAWLFGWSRSAREWFPKPVLPSS